MAVRKPAKAIEFVPQGSSDGIEIRARSVTFKNGVITIRLFAGKEAKKKQKIAEIGKCSIIVWSNKTKSDLGMFSVSVSENVVTGLKL